MTYAADAIQPQLPDDLVARVEENVRLNVDEQLLALRNPDVYVVESREPLPTQGGGGGCNDGRRSGGHCG